MLRVKGLGVIYLMVFRVWLTDDSADLSRTMATLDSRLRQAEQFSNSLPGRRARRGRARTDDAPDEIGCNGLIILSCCAAQNKLTKICAICMMRHQ